VIALDTNVLVRFLVRDHEEQSARARELIRRHMDDGRTCLVPDIVLCETVWVLQSCYGFTKAEIVRVMRALSRARHVTFQSDDYFSRALDRFESGQGDFADYLISQVAKANGCEAVATFDRALLKESGFIEP
jgi:predicted nucleic-acid-binding protein